MRYEIPVEGVLDGRWSAWFDGLHVSGDPDVGTTTIAGPVTDQAALHDLLAKVRDLGLPLPPCAVSDPTDTLTEGQQPAGVGWFAAPDGPARALRRASRSP